MARLSKIIKSAYPLRDFEGFDKSNSIAKAIENMVLNTKPNGNALSNIKAMKLASESVSPSASIAKAMENMVLNTKPNGNVLSNTKAVKPASDNKKNDDD